METHELFSGSIRFVPFILIINCILIIHFFASWIISARKTGWAVRPWYFSLLFTYFLPFLMMYPFASSSYNVRSVGNHIFAIQGAITEAYFVSLTGYMAVFTGGAIFEAYRFNSVVNWVFVKPIKSTLGFLFERVVVNRTVSRLMFYLYFGALLIMLAVAYKAGSLNDPRGYFYKNEGIGRALYNLTGSFSGIVSFILIARIFQFNKLADKIYLGIFILGTVFIGSRSTALGPLMTIFIYFIYFSWKGKIKLGKLIVFGLIMVTLVTTLSVFRAGKKASPNQSGGAVNEVLYGNSFSDLRDFAWVLSAWNKEPFYGKTYLSAFMSFVPSTYSSFRTEYGIGRITARLGGFNTKEHPGLRPGVFGESYLNFGIIGVIILGLVIGYTTRYNDYIIRLHAYTNNKLEVFKTSLSFIVVANLSITSGFFSVYVAFAIYSLLYGSKLFLKSFE